MWVNSVLYRIPGLFLFLVSSALGKMRFLQSGRLEDSSSQRLPPPSHPGLGPLLRVGACPQKFCEALTGWALPLGSRLAT